MFTLLKSSWALFFGIAMIFLANGLQGTLIGVRASTEGYSPFIVGIIMTGYYAGFMLGAIIIPERIQKVGHVRVFASLASIASIAILLHTLHFSLISWFLMRFATGFCFVGMYCVAESWINDQSENESRGQALSIYMIISMGGNAIGQLFLNFADPNDTTLFMLVSILISMSLVPILITVGKQPDYSITEILSIRQLYKASPLGVVSSIAVGTAHGALWGVGSVYTLMSGLSVSQTSFFMFSFISGGAIFQYIIGYLSDIYDRRLVLTIVSFTASLLSVLALIFSADFNLLLIIAFIFGGLTVPLYSLAIAHTNDFLSKSEMIAASGGLLFVAGIGLTIGPIIAGLFMNFLGSNGFWIYLFIIHTLIGIYALYRISVRDSVPLNEQRSAVFVTSRSSPAIMELYPDAEDLSNEN
jgi:MFS family permease|tara:strand:+ start:1490 stop:2731 length:1242 start_codon:yes stop_codon:yes gene_type:complete